MEPRSGFRPEFLDFKRGIHVGNLEENQRITRILKLALESRYGQPLVTERWGRGVYWRWIGLLARANREAKPISSNVSFGCAKYFISVDPEEQLFKCGMQVERGYVKAPRGSHDWQLQLDWDWNRLLGALRRGSFLDQEISRLLREGFQVYPDGWEGRSKKRDVTKLKQLLQAAPGNEWAWFQLFYPMTEKEVQAANGADLVDSMLAVFDEVTPVMNLCMQVQLRAAAG
ncbi:MAG: hypothetical protein EHM65_04545 [Acidobacteriales bacterium]|nr:MAG: hypothetical protein EHM65_04545 [Terriglobales bacterium]